VHDAAWSAEVSATAIGVGREEAGGAQRVLESSREEETEASRQSGFEQRRTRRLASGEGSMELLSLSLSSLFRECEGSVWITEAELYF
jgi:hypothetical protein